MMDKKYIIGFLIGIIVLVGIIVVVSEKFSTSGPDLTAFAQCLKQKGATFYGAFWCPHCQATKRMFGAAKDQLPYVECSTPDGNAQTQVCIDKGIKQYPTWFFPDGTQASGELTLDFLSQKTSCPLPAGAGTGDQPSSLGSSSSAV